mmetsp:Transcript_51779/g.112262  ORF Transcript_51779/g.112262 Transcript_51779/m.112262 type:complete len:242 (+) Transcript_51779:589-1314(+)
MEFVESAQRLAEVLVGQLGQRLPERRPLCCQPRLRRHPEGKVDTSPEVGEGSLALAHDAIAKSHCLFAALYSLCPERVVRPGQRLWRWAVRWVRRLPDDRPFVWCITFSPSSVHFAQVEHHPAGIGKVPREDHPPVCLGQQVLGSVSAHTASLHEGLSRLLVIEVRQFPGNLHGRDLLGRGGPLPLLLARHDFVQARCGFLEEGQALSESLAFSPQPWPHVVAYQRVVAECVVTNAPLQRV